MGRPSKLTERQWAEVMHRIDSGESVNSIAKSLKMSEGSIRGRIKTKEAPLKVLANQIAIVENKFDALPISAKLKVRNIADTLKGISHHLGNAAEYGAMTSHRLAMIANQQVDMIDETAPFDNVETLRAIGGLTEMANKAAVIGTNLIAANKGTDLNTPDAPNKLHDISDAELLSIATGGS